MRDGERVQRVHAHILCVSSVSRVAAPRCHRHHVLPNAEVDVRGRGDGAGGGGDGDMVAVLDPEARRGGRVNLDP